MINEFTFKECKKLAKVEIPRNSNLKIIKSHAFVLCKFKNIFIPPKVEKIGKLAFYLCQYLVNVEIPMNSELKKNKQRSIC